MHRHEYEFWLRKYDLDGFSARATGDKVGSGLTSPYVKARESIDRSPCRAAYEKEGERG